MEAHGRLWKEVGTPGDGETVAQTRLALQVPQLLQIPNEDPGPGPSLSLTLEMPLSNTLASTGPLLPTRVPTGAQGTKQ